MPLNPFTGEFEGYDSPSTQAGMGMAAMSAARVDAPLAFRMLEDAPGITASIGFSSMRGSNTIMRGGYSRKNYLDLDRRIKSFSGTKARRTRAATTLNRFGEARTPYLRRALQNNLPRLGNLTRYSDLSIFGASSRGLYTPFAASTLLGKSSRISSALGVEGVDNAFGPGLLSFISAGTKSDRLEARALKGSTRARKKLGRVDRSIGQLIDMNSPGLRRPVVTPATTRTVSTVGQIQIGNPALQGAGIKKGRAVVKKGNTITMNGKQYVGGTGSRFLPQTMSIPVAGRVDDAVYDVARRSMVPGAGVGSIGATQTGMVGVRGNLMASTMAGVGTQKIAGYFRGAMGYGQSIGYVGLEGASKAGARMAEKQFVTAFRGAGLGTRSAAYSALQAGNLYKSVGMKGMSQIATSGGAKVLAARGIGLAIPGLQVLAAASFAYDIGKMAGEVVKSSINLARDSVKSLQGSIHKPLFGMGYQDTEAAATSRARGVMAIQNSRLNARSVLGSEAGMMAAHFG